MFFCQTYATNDSISKHDPHLNVEKRKKRRALTFQAFLTTVTTKQTVDSTVEVMRDDQKTAKVAPNDFN